MSGAVAKAVKELETLLKKASRSGKKGKSYYDILSDQVNADGTWDEELLTEVKQKINEFLGKYNQAQLLKMWEETEAALDFTGSADDVEPARVKDDVAEELLNRVLDSLDSNYDEDNYFTESKFRGGDEEEDDFYGDKFDDLDDNSYGSDSYFDDDDKY